MKVTVSKDKYHLSQYSSARVELASRMKLMLISISKFRQEDKEVTVALDVSGKWFYTAAEAYSGKYGLRDEYLALQGKYRVFQNKMPTTGYISRVSFLVI